MPNFKYTVWTLAILLVAGLYCFIEADGSGDFSIFMSASGGLRAHRNIYEAQYSGFYNYFYSVLFALILEPFYTWPYFWVKLGWLLLNMLLYGRLFQLLARARAVKDLAPKQRNLFLFFVFLFSLRFLHENIHTSQITILILWCSVEGLYRIHRKQATRGSALLALGINIKLMPVVLLPYLLYRGYFKAFGLTCLFYVLSFLAPSLIIGHDYNMQLIKSWAALINPVQPRHVLDVEERSFHGLSTLVATLFVEQVPDVYALPIKRNIADISLSALFKLLLVLRLALIGLTLYFLKWPPFCKAKTTFAAHTEISYLLLITPLLFPHQQHYAFLFITPAFAVALYYVMQQYASFSKKKRLTLASLLFLIYVVSNLKLLLGEFNPYYEHFKILTYAALLLIPLLAWVLYASTRQRPLFIAQN